MQILDDLKNSMLAKGLDESDLKLLAGIAHEREFFKDAIIFQENDLEECIYILFEGKIAIERHSLSGRKIGSTVIHNVRHGQMIGEMGFVEGKTRSATAIAKSSVRLAQFQFADLESLIQNNPLFGIRLLRNISGILSQRLRRMNEQWLRSIVTSKNHHEFEYF